MELSVMEANSTAVAKKLSTPNYRNIETLSNRRNIRESNRIRSSLFSLSIGYLNRTSRLEIVHRLSGAFRNITVAVFLAFAAISGLAQQVSSIGQAGTTIPGSYQPNGIDTINLRNGAVILNIPLLSYPQLGNKLKLSFSLRYSPLSWFYDAGQPTVVSSSPHMQYSGGWYVSDPQVAFPVGVTLVRDQQLVSTVEQLNYVCSENTSLSCPAPQNGSQANEEKISANLYSLITSDKAIHNFGISDSTQTYYTYTPTLDGSNFMPIGSGPQPPTNFIGPDGVTYSPVAKDGTTALSGFNQTDPDGNTISVSASGWIDSIGRNIPGSITGPGDGYPTRTVPGDPNPGTVVAQITHCPKGTTSERDWNVPGPNGSTALYVLCFNSQSITTDFVTINSQPDVDSIFSTASQGSGTYLLLTQLILPNSTSYQFAYDSWGELESVTLPSGGSISYEYATVLWDTDDVEHQQSRVISSRTTHNTDGTAATWTYALSQAGFDADVSAADSTMLITDPSLNDESHNFTSVQNKTNLGFYPTETINYYTGTGKTRVLSKTVVLVSSQAFNPFMYPVGPTSSTKISPPLPGPLLSATTTLQDTNQISEKVYTTTPSTGSITYYNFNENAGTATGTHSFTANTLSPYWSTLQPSTVSEYDYGAGNVGSLIRTTATTYQWQQAAAYKSSNLLNLPYQVSVADGSGAQTSLTTYGYDENGSPQGTLGHNTSIARWVNVGPATKSQTSFNAQGVPNLFTDADGNQTSISTYQCSGLFPQNVVTPYKSANTTAETFTFGYDCASGSIVSVLDPNQNTMSYSYDSLNRLTGVTYPDGGSVGISFNGDPVPPLVTQTVATGGVSGSIIRSTLYDGFARVTGDRLDSAPGGATLSTTTYNVMGLVQSISNPYLANSSPNAYTSFSYDRFGRTLLKCQPDNSTSPTTSCAAGLSYQKWGYSGNTVSFTDESNNQWQRTVDALGRLTQVVEPGTLTTTYTYDSLDNLLSVNQAGLSSSGDQPRIRTFTYDSLSRLICSANPESSLNACPVSATATMPSGVVQYGYDANSNLISKADARGVTTSFSYDALNRITSKSFPSDTSSTPTTCYQYDSSTQALSPANMIGRLANEWTQSSTITSCPAALATTPKATEKILTTRSILSYDAMGRVTQEQQCATPGCVSGGTPYLLNHDYDLAGNPTLYTNGVGSISLTNQYDAAGRLSSITSSWSDATHPDTLLSGVVRTPAGDVTNAQYGGGNLTRIRTFDLRRRITSENDSGNTVQNPTNGSAAVVITGEEQHQ